MLLGNMRKFFGIVGALFFGLSTPTLAERVTELSLSTSYNNNVLRDSNSQGDYITQLQGGLSWLRRSEQSQTQFYYTGTGYMFAQAGMRSFGLNGVGTSFARKLGKGRQVTLGSFASVRLNRSGYNIYDNLGWQNNAGFKMMMPHSVMLNLAYTLQVRRYWRMQDQNYMNHTWSMKMGKLFSTRTQVRVQLGYGLKDHSDSEGQILFGFEAGQPLGPNTALNLRYERRWNTHANIFDEDLLVQDIDMLNSWYDYDGQLWAVQLTQLLTDRKKLVISGGVAVRHYQTLTTLAWRGVPLFADELRRDRNPYFSVAFETPLNQAVTAKFIYDFESNQSNDSFYNFGKRNNLSVDLAIAF